MDTQRDIEISTGEQFERCIMCGALTCIPISMPIDWRENYEIGCGQLCSECVASRKKAEDQERLQTTAMKIRAAKQRQNKK